MPTLNEIRDGVARLIREKGFHEDVEHALLCAFVELGEAGNIWKKTHASGEYNDKGKMVDARLTFFEELIDVIFYLASAAIALDKNTDLDKVFTDKLAYNFTRPRRYGEAEVTNTLKLNKTNFGATGKVEKVKLIPGRTKAWPHSKLFTTGD